MKLVSTLARSWRRRRSSNKNNVKVRNTRFSSDFSSCRESIDAYVSLAFCIRNGMEASVYFVKIALQSDPIGSYPVNEIGFFGHSNSLYFLLIAVRVNNNVGIMGDNSIGKMWTKCQTDN